MSRRAMPGMLLVPLMLTLLAPGDARAQEAPAGDAGASLAASHALDLTAWFGSGYDNRSARWPLGALTVDPLFEADNAHGQAGIGLAFARTRQRLAFSAGIQSGLRSDSAARQPWAFDHRATASLGMSPTRRTRVDLRHMAKLTTINPLAVLADANAAATPPAPPGHDQPYAVRQALSTVSGATMTHAISRRTSVVLTYGYTYTGSDGGTALEAHQAGGRVERRVSAVGVARFGYRLTAASFDPAARRFLNTHDIETGFEFRRPLPFSRRTLVTAGAGSSLVNDRSQRGVRVLADVTLLHPLGRAWLLRLGWSRPVQLLEGLAAPLVSSTFSGVLTGTVGRRHSIVASATTLAGHTSLDRSTSTAVDSYTTSLRWQTALARRVALNAEVVHSRLRFGPTVVIVSGIAPDSSHVGARAFVSVSHPLHRD